MAIIETSRPAPFGAVTVYRLVAFVERGLIALRTWDTNRRTANALSSLSDHELQDIGLSRGDIADLGRH